MKLPKDIAELNEGVPPELRRVHLEANTTLVELSSATSQVGVSSLCSPGEIVENVECIHLGAPAISTNPTISPPPCTRVHPVPEDSAIADYRDTMRGISEAPDSWLVAPILAVVARLLTPGVWLDFAGHKPVTLFQFLAGPAGLRKSTSTNPADRIAAKL